MIWNWLWRHPRLVDGALLAFLLLATAVVASHHTNTAATLALGAAQIVPLAWRRRRPLAVLVAVTGIALLIVALGLWLLPFPLCVALYTLAAGPDGPVARATAIGAATAITAARVGFGGSETGDSVSAVVLMAAAWLLGESVGSRRAYVNEIEEKADRLEREREAEAGRAAAEEQARIARELHDVIAHALSVIVVQAGAAEDVFRLEPRRAREPIRAIDSAARAALADLRRVLGSFHQDAELEPQPGLGRIDGLIEQVRGTGLEVSLVIEGPPQPLPATVDLSAYRIVQEALTNTLKHGGAGHARVRVRYGDELELEIRDDGRGSANGAGAGRGLIGMRERAAMLGGSVEAGTNPSGGYVVSARLPVGAAG